MGLIDKNIINELNNRLDEGEYIIRFYDGTVSDIYWTKRDLIDFLKYSDNHEKFSIYKLDKSVYDYNFVNL